jgi:hypothetical protein
MIINVEAWNGLESLKECREALERMPDEIGLLEVEYGLGYKSKTLGLQEIIFFCQTHVRGPRKVWTTLYAWRDDLQALGPPSHIRGPRRILESFYACRVGCGSQTS